MILLTLSMMEKKCPLDEILKEISQYKTKYVTVTGGEPLAQKPCWDLLKNFGDKGYSGFTWRQEVRLSIEGIDEENKSYSWISKRQSLGSSLKNDRKNLALIDKKDEIKFVISSREDYEWAKTFIKEENLIDKAPIIFSPVYAKLSYERFIKLDI